jgi:hypothetical protein
MTTAPAWARLRVRIALGLLLLYAGASAARWAHEGLAWRRAAGQDDISANERRFAELRVLLPDSGLVGYLGDPPPTGPTPRDSTAAALLHFRRYLLAQYALAPALLIESTEPELVVGNFDPGPAPPTPAGFRVERAFGDGLVLFRQVRP